MKNSQKIYLFKNFSGRMQHCLNIFLIIIVTIFFTNCNTTENLHKPFFWKTGENIDVSYNIKSNNAEKNTEVFREFDAPTKDSLERTLKMIFLKYNNKCISASVFVPGKGFWANTISNDDYKNEVEPAITTKFHAASIGKMFTSVVIFQLIEEGKLSLQDRIIKWFPDLYPEENITIKNLINHTSGIISFDLLKEYNKPNYYPESGLLELVKKNKIIFKPGSYYSYSNTGYILLGLIAEKVTGNGYSQLIKERITKKIGLINTEAITNETKNRLSLKGYHQGKLIEPNENYSNPHAAGNIITTPSDLVRFFYSLYTGKLCLQSSVKAMFLEMNLMGEKPNVYYGKGITLIKDTPSGDYAGHSGGFPGFRSALYYRIETGVFVCVMTNDDKMGAEPAMFKLAECIKRK